MNNLFSFDNRLGIVIGTDEAGRGPAAGGVFASCVYFPEVNSGLKKSLDKLNDSKKLSKTAREDLYNIIINNSVNSTVCIEVEEIEKINILNSSLKAMKLACENVIKQANLSDFLTIIDGNRPIKNYDYPQKFIVKGTVNPHQLRLQVFLQKLHVTDIWMCWLKSFRCMAGNTMPDI